MDALHLQSLRQALAAWVEGLAPCFAKSVTFDHFRRYLLGLRGQPWRGFAVKDTTGGTLTWEYKAARVYLSDSSHPDHNIAAPTDRKHWLIVMRQPKAGEVKYVVSNAGQGESPEDRHRDKHAIDSS